jgi:hypothetical protein
MSFTSKLNKTLVDHFMNKKATSLSYRILLFNSLIYYTCTKHCYTQKQREGRKCLKKKEVFFRLLQQWREVS